MARVRSILISLFVATWILLFNYESTRHFYLQPWLDRSLPKLKFLFPPAGWIMFFNLDDSYGYAQVYGIKDGQSQALDPYQILQTRAIGYDNIKRNALASVISRDSARPFCDYLRRKFPYFDSFAVTYVNHPSLTKRPFEKQQVIAYECR